MTSNNAISVLDSGLLYGEDENKEDIYKMTAQKRGYCCIFLNKTFQINGLNEIRDGSEVDMILFKSVFEQLNFEIYDQSQLTDLRADEIGSKLNLILNNKYELKTHNAFIAIFSSHGNESVIYGSDGEEVQIKDIIEKFSNQNCPQLAGCPKIFIFICCRGDKLPEAISLHSSYASYLNYDNEEDDMDVPIMEDIMICYSTVNTFVSLRDPLMGTFYGRFLAENIARYARDKDFEIILKKTAQQMSKKDGLEYCGAKLKLMTSWRAIGWRKLLYFNPGYPK